jgi:hypothetical protein
MESFLCAGLFYFDGAESWFLSIEKSLRVSQAAARFIFTALSATLPLDSSASPAERDVLKGARTSAANLNKKPSSEVVSELGGTRCGFMKDSIPGHGQRS